LKEPNIFVNIVVYLPQSTTGADIVIVMCLPLTIVSNAMDFVGVDPLYTK
jgi:hypothetical protein